MDSTDPLPEHTPEEAVCRAWATHRDATGLVATAGLRLLGTAVPERFPGARYLHLRHYHDAPVLVRITGSAGEDVKRFNEDELARDLFASMVTTAVAALDKAQEDTWLLWDGACRTQGAATVVDLAECARVVSDVPLRYHYTVVGVWSRPEEIPGCADREPVDDFVERVEARTAAEAARIALSRQVEANPVEAAPTDAGYGMEPRVIAAFPLQLWPAAQ